MAGTIKGKIRRIAYNPFRGSPLNPSPTVVFYLEGDGTKYVIGSIAKGFAETVLLSRPGDEIEASTRTPLNQLAVGLVVENWLNLTFEAEQESLTIPDA